MVVRAKRHGEKRGTHDNPGIYFQSITFHRTEGVFHNNIISPRLFYRNTFLGENIFLEMSAKCRMNDEKKLLLLNLCLQYHPWAAKENGGGKSIHE